MEIKISDVIKRKRREANISQEALSEALGISVQAVSKWETGISCPDITMLPKIAEYFKIDLNELFFDIKAPSEAAFSDELPDDGKLRVVQYMGNKLLSEKKYDPNTRIMLELPENDIDSLNVEIWGSADIQGDISGGVHAGGGVNCGDIGGGVHAGDGVNCGDIGGGVHAGGGVNCGDIGGGVNAGDGINCGDIGGSAKAGDSIYCGDINNDAEAKNDIRCHDIKGNAVCGGNIIYEKNSPEAAANFYFE